LPEKPPRKGLEGRDSNSQFQQLPGKETTNLTGPLARNHTNKSDKKASMKTAKQVKSSIKKTSASLFNPVSLRYMEN
jgi:hypothetical protein